MNRNVCTIVFAPVPFGARRRHEDAIKRFLFAPIRGRGVKGLVRLITPPVAIGSPCRWCVFALAVHLLLLRSGSWRIEDFRQDEFGGVAYGPLQ
jgi:hypothetical protein